MVAIHVMIRYVKNTFTFMYIHVPFVLLCTLCTCMSLRQFVASISKIFFQPFFVESKFPIFYIVTQIIAGFDHFPYFSDLTEYRFRFILVSYEIKHVSHDGRNLFHLELLLAHCVQQHHLQLQNSRLK